MQVRKMKKYFRFTTLRTKNCLLTFFFVSLFFIRESYFKWQLSLSDFLVEYLKLTVMCVILSLIIDWTRLWVQKRKNKKND